MDEQNNNQNEAEIINPVEPEIVNDTPAEQPAKTLALISLICGIASLICCFGGVPGIPAIILAVIAKKKGNTGKLATAGLICGIIGLVIFGLGGIITLSLGVLGGLLESLEDQPSFYAFIGLFA